MIRAYDEYGNVVDLVKWENEIYQKGLKEAFSKLECEEFDTCLRIEYEKGKAYEKALDNFMTKIENYTNVHCGLDVDEIDIRTINEIKEELTKNSDFKEK